MSMMGYLAGVTPAQITAFRARPRLASDHAAASAMAHAERGLEAALARAPPPVRQAIEAARQRAAANDNDARRAADGPLAALGPWQPPLSLAKSWHILHFLIAGRAGDVGGPAGALLGGAPIGQDVGYGPPRLLDPGQTRAFAAVLAGLTPERLAARLDWPRMAADHLYPLSGVPDVEDAEMWREEIDETFARLTAYVAAAADRGDGLLVWLS